MTNALAGQSRWYDNHGHEQEPDSPNATEYETYPRALYMFTGVTGLATMAVLCIQTRYHRIEAEKAANSFQASVQSGHDHLTFEKMSP